MQLSDSHVASIPAHLLRPRVLIVEDENRLRDLLLDVIPDMGCCALAASRAEEATKLIELQQPEILLLDLHLPGMGGMELFERVHQRWPAIQVVIITGFGDLASARQAIQWDVVDFITKPFHLRDIELALNKARQRLVEGLRAAKRDFFAKDSLEPLNKAGPDDAMTLAESERKTILAALQRNNGNRSATARELAVSRRKLHYWLNQNRLG